MQTIIGSKLLIRRLSGFKKLPAGSTAIPTKLAKIEEMNAPDYQLGIKKPESGILEVKTGRVIAGKEEIKIIESDEAFQARMIEARQLKTAKSYYIFLPMIVTFFILYVYLYFSDGKNEPPPAFRAYWERQNAVQNSK